MLIKHYLESINKINKMTESKMLRITNVTLYVLPDIILMHPVNKFLSVVLNLVNKPIV